jgi:glutamate--cysteine ligase catalytic subunit
LLDFSLLGQRASGALKTNARFLRDLVTGHEDYVRDSKVTETIAYDILVKACQIQDGERPTELFGNIR